MAEGPIRQLNLGCGFDKRRGFINADNFPQCEPDVLLDIETLPWPFADDAFDYILMKHVLEHVGATFASFRGVMRELYRVTAPGGVVEIHIPYYRHQAYWSDPTHVRVFTPKTFEMMSKARNDEWIAAKSNYTMLAYALGVDFDLFRTVPTYDSAWQKKLDSGEVTQAEVNAAVLREWEVIKELKMALRAVKPWTGPHD